MVDETREDIINSFPALQEGPGPDDSIPEGTDNAIGEEPDAGGLPADDGAREAAPVVAEDAGQSAAAEAAPETPKEPEEADPELDTTRALQAHLATLPPEQLQAVLEAAGLVEPQAAEPAQPQPTPETASEFYDLKELIGPQADALMQIPGQMEQRFGELDRGLRDVFAAQSQVLDNTAVESALNTKIMATILEHLQLELPKVDRAAILEGVKAGKDFDTLITDALKPTMEKNAARMKQAKEARPETPDDLSNDYEGLPEKASMTDIFNHRRGRRVTA